MLCSGVTQLTHSQPVGTQLTPSQPAGTQLTPSRPAGRLQTQVEMVPELARIHILC